MMMRKLISTAAQIAGLGLATAGVFLLSIPVGLIVTGIVLVLVGVALGMGE